MNPSGIQPVDDRVLVAPTKIDRMTAGGIALPETVAEQEEVGHIKGTIVAMGAQAFEDIESPDQRPAVCAIVAMARYAGYLMQGKDGEEYRLVNDRDIAAVLDGDWDVRSKK